MSCIENLAFQESTNVRLHNNINSNHTANYDIKFHRLEFYIDPNIIEISGQITSYFIPNSDIHSINFDLSDKLSVEKVIYNNQNINFSHSNEDILTCNFPKELKTGILDSIIVVYSGVPSDEYGAFSQGYHNKIPIIWTLSEPYGSKDWWPCKQDLNDKADSIEVVIKSPSEYRSVSNGLLASETVIGKDRICVWKHHYPIPAYLIAIAVTNFIDHTISYKNINGDILPIQSFLYPENEESAKEDILYTVEVMELFETLFEIYPYSKEKYGYAQFGWNGGMENSTVSFMGQFSEDLIAHELAHQWFGDKITCGSWQDIWLNEGFATYLTGLSYEYIKDDFDYWLHRNINTITSKDDGSVFVNDTTSVSRIFSGRLSYSKGAMVLHMLRWKIGDENFFKATKNYLKDENLAFSYAKTDDLKEHMEKVYGSNLDKFFEQWIYGEGHPSYDIQWNQIEGDRLDLFIKQSQSHKSVEFFEMPIELLLEGTDGEKKYITINVEENDFKVSQELSFKVSSIQFDPNRWLITKDNSVSFNPNLSEDDNFIENYLIYFNKNNNIEIETNQEHFSRLQFTLFNSSGKVLSKRSVNGKNSYLIKASDLAKGIYYLNIKSNTASNTKTLVKT
ncbi:MAG: T9SS type A sorting domain-containing protein [Flavobacteriales bacterium]|nr:T9SS type A sorting domain-containing protein [Flavobacteriales bacterium]